MPKKENSENSSGSTDANCILLLTEAEKRAREVIDGAKKRKAVLVKKARDDSAAEIEQFRKEHEEALSKKQKQFSSGQDLDSVQIDKDLIKKTAELQQAFKTNSLNTLKDVLMAILNVEPKFHENLIY